MIENWIEVKRVEWFNEEIVLVKCIVEIRNNETGEIREFERNEPLEIGCEHPSVFNWEENNYSCDCNRHIFFKRIKGEPIDDVECGDGKYSVNLKNKKDGKIYYREFETLS